MKTFHLNIELVPAMVNGLKLIPILQFLWYLDPGYFTYPAWFQEPLITTEAQTHYLKKPSTPRMP